MSNRPLSLNAASFPSEQNVPKVFETYNISKANDPYGLFGESLRFSMQSKPLGNSIFAKVFPGELTSMGRMRSVAIKAWEVPDMALDAYRQVEKQVTQEVKALQSISQRSAVVVQILHYLSVSYPLPPNPLAKNYQLLVMELCDQSLEEYIVNEPPLDSADQQRLIQSLFRAYKDCHAGDEGICHRDVKPENVLVIKTAGQALKLKVWNAAAAAAVTSFIAVVAVVIVWILGSL